MRVRSTSTTHSKSEGTRFVTTTTTSTSAYTTLIFKIRRMTCVRRHPPEVSLCLVIAKRRVDMCFDDNHAAGQESEKKKHIRYDNPRPRITHLPTILLPFPPPPPLSPLFTPWLYLTNLQFQLNFSAGLNTRDNNVGEHNELLPKTSERLPIRASCRGRSLLDTLFCLSVWMLLLSAFSGSQPTSPLPA